MSNQLDNSVRTSRTSLTHHERQALARARCWLPKISAAADASHVLAGMIGDHLTCEPSGEEPRFTDRELGALCEAIQCCADLAGHLTSELIDATAEVRS